jgi:branched-chain amino acid transport system substrate-binding protein
VVIGSVGEQSGVIGSIIGSGPKAVQAWVASINATSGLHCHHVKYVIVDDGGDPSKHQSLVQQLVEQNHVIAFVQMDAPLTGQASVNYLTQRAIPVIGSETGGDWFYSSPTYFPQAGSGDQVEEAVFGVAAQAAALHSAHQLGVISCVEANICSSGYALAPRYAAEFGLNLVYRGQVSLAQPDYTSACQSAKTAGVQLLAVGTDANSLKRIARSCDGVNFHPRFVAGANITLQLADDPQPAGRGVSAGAPAVCAGAEAGSRDDSRLGVREVVRGRDPEPLSDRAGDER